MTKLPSPEELRVKIEQLREEARRQLEANNPAKASQLREKAARLLELASRLYPNEPAE